MSIGISFWILMLFFSTVTAETCITSSKISVTFSGRKNKTGHWLTQVQVDFSGHDSPSEWTTKVEQIQSMCDSGPILHIVGEFSGSPRVVQGYEAIGGSGYYKLHTEVKSWEDAKAMCEQEGAHLAIINSDDESHVMKSLLARHPLVQGSENNHFAHIGFDDKRREGQYYTILGEMLNATGFLKWSPGQPDNHRYEGALNAVNGEDCGSVDRNGLLNDILCPRKLAFICEVN